MDQILVGQSTKGVFLTDKFPKIDEKSVTGVYLAGFNSVEEVLFSKDRNFFSSEFASNIKQIINFSDLLPTFSQDDFKIWVTGKTYYKLNGEEEADNPAVLTTRPIDKIIPPYNTQINLSKETSKLTAEAELAIIFDNDGSLKAYAYALDPTTREFRNNEEKLGVKNCQYAVSFAVVADKPIQEKATYQFKGQDINRNFDCILHHNKNHNIGLTKSESDLLDYLRDTGVGAKKITGCGLLMAGNPTDEKLRVEHNTDIGNSQAQKNYGSKIINSLKSTYGVKQELLINSDLVLSTIFRI